MKHSQSVLTHVDLVRAAGWRGFIAHVFDLQRTMLTCSTEGGVANYTTMLLREDLDVLLMDCKNFIKILHKRDDNKMYVCGTNAFDPECDYMSYADGQLTLERKVEDGKGKCPFDPFQRHTSLMLENNLYSATSMNFLGSEPVLMRSSPVTIRTEFKSSWLNEPTFVSMTQIPESQMSAVGDDDKVYLFFSEVAVDCDCHNKLLVSRVARVCKGDIGGERTLQKKWTSFLKARMDCPVLESQLPYVIQDVYHWCGSHQGWRDCLFYACIDNKARNNGIYDTLHLPDPTLQFIKLRPLMDQTIQPIGGKPLLVHKGAAFTRIVVNQVQAADGEKYHVMFMGTEEGTLVKGVNYDGEMFLIEEVQVFQPRVSIKILKFSNVTGQLYAGSDSGVTQVPLATCGRSMSCMDCVLSRDPYCGWDKVDGKCSLLSSSTRELIQSVKEGDAKLCPPADPLIPLKRTIWPGGNLKLYCHSPSQLAKTVWEKDGNRLSPNGHFQSLEDGLLIFNGSNSDAGRYRCLSVEKSKAGQFSTTMAEYQVGLFDSGDGISTKAQINGPSMAGLKAVVGLLVVCLLGLLTWNCYKGHIPLPWNCRRTKEQTEEQAGPRSTVDVKLSPAEDILLMSRRNNTPI
ncbi:hypothetical protein fugu_014044 [Takifugu bimaculatus]|uniref:Sema domain-containing protein n=1 Tax=Takifugu bimaculatus TaxID=433685 RepID=A0A4Z2C1C4_9TELE|nr:hypothetical protein fugu_014044 [Takifugu bimaculatus]